MSASDFASCHFRSSVDGSWAAPESDGTEQTRSRPSRISPGKFSEVKVDRGSCVKDSLSGVDDMEILTTRMICNLEMWRREVWEVGTWVVDNLVERTGRVRRDPQPALGEIEISSVTFRDTRVYAHDRDPVCKETSTGDKVPKSKGQVTDTCTYLSKPCDTYIPTHKLDLKTAMADSNSLVSITYAYTLYQMKPTKSK